MDFSPVPVIRKRNAQAITTPITIFAAKHDVLFPGEKMIKRAAQIFPSLKQVRLLEDSKHVQHKGHNEVIETVILSSLGNIETPNPI